MIREVTCDLANLFKVFCSYFKETSDIQILLSQRPIEKFWPACDSRSQHPSKQWELETESALYIRKIFYDLDFMILTKGLLQLIQLNKRERNPLYSYPFYMWILLKWWYWILHLLILHLSTKLGLSILRCTLDKQLPPLSHSVHLYPGSCRNFPFRSFDPSPFVLAPIKCYLRGFKIIVMHSTFFSWDFFPILLSLITSATPTHSHQCYSFQIKAISTWVKIMSLQCSYGSNCGKTN